MTRAIVSMFLVLAATSADADDAFQWDAVNQEVEVVMDSIDDLSYIIVVNGEKALIAGKAEWRPTVTGGESGQGRANLRRHLVSGHNYIIIGLYNRAWAGPGGKWSYAFQVLTGKPGGAPLEEFWVAKDRGPDDGQNTRRMIMVKAIHAFVDSKGDVTLDHSVDHAVKGEIKAAVLTLENQLVRSGEDLARVIPEWITRAAEVVEAVSKINEYRK